jgi:hypothetical protein
MLTAKISRICVVQAALVVGVLGVALIMEHAFAAEGQSGGGHHDIGKSGEAVAPAEGSGDSQQSAPAAGSIIPASAMNKRMESRFRVGPGRASGAAAKTGPGQAGIKPLPAIRNLHRRTFPAHPAPVTPERNAIGARLPNLPRQGEAPLNGARANAGQAGFSTALHHPTPGTANLALGASGSFAVPSAPIARPIEPRPIVPPPAGEFSLNRGAINGASLGRRGLTGSSIGGPSIRSGGINGTTVRRPR